MVSLAPEVLALDALFVALLVFAGFHLRNLLRRDAPWYDLAGHLAVDLLILAWAFIRLEATFLAQLMLLLAAVAAAVPLLRGLAPLVERIRRSRA